MADSEVAQLRVDLELLRKQVTLSNPLTTHPPGKRRMLPYPNASAR